ncbi:UNVERIFIED_ORG: hypothetical protein GGD59_002860 [Rhizobium esperanzae]
MHSFRLARQADLAAIIRLLADDDLGSAREIVADPIDPRYLSAFAAIEPMPTRCWPWQATRRIGSPAVCS